MTGIYTQHVYADQQSIGEKVAAIDQHITATDARMDQAERDRVERSARALATNTRQDDLIMENRDRISHDEGYALGAFMAIMAAQTFGLIRSFKQNKD